MSPRRTLWLSVLATLLAARVAGAVCPVTTACNDAAAILANPACCGAHNCVLDGTLTLSGTTCALEFDGRDLTISGTVNVGSNTLRLSAASITISGQLNARGTGQNPGGNLTLVTSGGQPTALRLTSGGSGPRIDLSGAGRGAGVLQIIADGDVALDGRIEASALVAAGDGGRVSIETPGGMAINASIAATGGGFGIGGTIDLLLERDISLGSSVRVAANGGDGGDVSIDSDGAFLIVPSARIEASGLSTQAGFGGTVTISSASADIQGVIESKGGGDPAGDAGGDGGEITIEVASGPLLLTRNASSAIVVEGGGGGSAGVVSLTTNSPINGTLVIDAAISAGGRGGSTVRPGGGGEISIDSAHALDVKKIIDAHGTGAGTGEVELVAGRDVTITNNLLLDDPALGGALALDAGRDLIINGDLRARATSNGGGGLVSLSAGRDVLVKNTIDASASGSNAGGDIAFDAGRNITLERAGIIRANGGGTASGGAIDIHAGFFDLAGNLLLDGDVLARGGSTASARSAVIQLRGCQIAIGGKVDSSGDTGSLNSITARTGIAVTGEVRATGSNTLVHTGAAPSFGNKVTPPLMASSRPVCTANNTVACLVPCPNCGNGTLEFPEQCEPTAANCGTCSNRCRTRTCDDGAPCTTNGCDLEFGCLNNAVADGTICVDADPCTPTSDCQRGACLGQRNCDDDNQCTTDSCNGANGCAHVAVDCDDDNPCTLGDACNPQTGCTHTGLKQCDAGQVCDPANGNCVPKPCQSANDCDDGNPCTSQACGANGFCTVTPLTGPECDEDGNRCNGVAVCQAGACVDRAPCEPDQDVCTVDDCVPAVGCTHEKIPGCCNEVADCAPVTVCTACNDHQCGRTSETCCTTDSDCDDLNPCTGDGTCAANECPAKQPLSGVSCGNPCNPGECVAGECVAGTPIECEDDGDLCTDDFCDPATGQCTHAPIDGCCLGDTPGECGDICTFCQIEVNRCASVPGCVACSRDTDCDPDGRCTGNACGSDGKCTTVEPTNCSDNLPGTNDICSVDGNGAPVCRHVCLNPGACDDGNACNGVEACNAGTCAAGPALDCDDGDACTVESCDPARGCVRTDEQDFAAVRCELDNIAAALAGAAPGDISAKVRSKIERLLTKARAQLAAAEAARAGKKAQKALAAVKAQAKMIRGATKTAIKKRKMSAALGERILGASDGAGQAAQALRSRLRT